MACPQPPRKPFRPQRDALEANPPVPKRRRPAAALLELATTPGRLGMLLALLMLLAGTALLSVTPSPAPELQHAAAVAAPDVGEADAGVTVDVNQDALTARGRKVPEEPQANWARPPCAPGYATLNGACWVVAANAPPCPVGMYEHGGRCYLPLTKAPRPPSSVEE